VEKHFFSFSSFPFFSFGPFLFDISFGLFLFDISFGLFLFDIYFFSFFNPPYSF
jgi:hypothetical protein